MSQWTEMWIILEPKKVQEIRQCSTYIFILRWQFFLHVSSSASHETLNCWFSFSPIRQLLSGQSNLSLISCKTRLSPKRQCHTSTKILKSSYKQRLLVFGVRSWRGRSLCASTHGSNDGKTSLRPNTSVFLQRLSKKLIQPGDHRPRVVVQPSGDHGVVINLVRRKIPFSFKL